MENTWHLPCLSLIDLSRNSQAWAELHKPTLWGDRQWRRVQSSQNSLTLGIPLPSILPHILERILLHGEHLGTWKKPPTHPNSPHIVQTMKWSIKGCMVWTIGSWATSLIIIHYHHINMSSSSSNSSPSCPGPLDNQCFHHIFPTALPHCQWNILYATILQQPSLVINLEI